MDTPEETINDVLVAGKSVAFLSLFGERAGPVPERSSLVGVEPVTHQNAEYFRFNSSCPPRPRQLFDLATVATTRRQQQERLTRAIIDDFRFLKHLDFIRLTILTAQGDFICVSQESFVDSDTVD